MGSSVIGCSSSLTRAEHDCRTWPLTSIVQIPYTSSRQLIAHATGVVRRPLRGVSTNRMIDVLARPENLRRRSVLLVAEALERVMTTLAS